MQYKNSTVSLKLAYAELTGLQVFLVEREVHGRFSRQVLIIGGVYTKEKIVKWSNEGIREL